MSPAPPRGRRLGVLVVGAGVLLLSPDSLSVRLLSMDYWTIVFWRGVCTALGYLALARARGARDRRGARGRAAIATLTAIGNLCFVYSVTHATAAQTLVIFASAPVFAALITRACRLEPVTRRTWLTTTVVLAGIAAIVLRPDQVRVSEADLAALAGAVALATLLVVVRHSGDTEVVPTLALGAALTAVVAAPFADMAAVGADDALVLVLGFALALPLSLSLVMRGLRLLAAPEVGLIMLLETVLGPVWVWLAVGERPEAAVTLAGAVVVVTLAASAVAALRTKRSLATLPSLCSVAETKARERSLP